MHFPAFITFGRLEAVSFTHSCIYTALLVCAFVLRNPEPATFILGLGPFCGSAGFIVESRRRRRAALPSIASR